MSRAEGPKPDNPRGWISQHPVTGLPVEATVDFGSLDSSPTSRALDRAEATILARQSDQTEILAALRILETYRDEPRTSDILERAIQKRPEPKTYGEEEIEASLVQIACAVQLEQTPGGREKVLRILNSSQEDTARAAILSALQGRDDPEYRQEMRLALQDDSRIVRIAATSALLDRSIDDFSEIRTSELEQDLSAQEALAVARYAMEHLRQDIRPPKARDGESTLKNIIVIQDYVTEHPDPEVRRFIDSAARGEQGADLAAEACAMLSRVAEPEAGAIIADSYIRGVGDVRQSLFKSDLERQFLRTIPNPALVAAAERVFLAQDSKTDERMAAFFMLRTADEERYHASFCSVFADKARSQGMAATLKEQLANRIDTQVIDAAIAVLDIPAPRWNERLLSWVTSPFRPKKGPQAEDTPAERHQTHALELLEHAEHPGREQAIRNALRSTSEGNVWKAATMLGPSDRDASRALGKLPRLRLISEVESAIASQDRAGFEYIVESSLPEMLDGIKRVIRFSSDIKTLQRVGDILAERINRGSRDDVELIVDLLESRITLNLDSAFQRTMMLDRVALRALSQVDELLSDEVGDVSDAFSRAGLNESQAELARQIIERLSSPLSRR